MSFHLLKFIFWPHMFLVLHLHSKLNSKGWFTPNVTSWDLRLNSASKHAWVWMKLGIKIKHEEKIIWCKFEEKSTHRLFFLVLRRLYNFDQCNLFNVSRKAHGCDPWIFIFTSMYYDTLDPFWAKRKSLMLTQKKCLLLPYEVWLKMLFKEGASVTCG